MQTKQKIKQNKVLDTEVEDIKEGVKKVIEEEKRHKRIFKFSLTQY